MALIVQEGTPPLLVRYETWDEWRALRRPAEPAEPPPARGTGFCGWCRGQGRSLDPAANGEGLVPRTCPCCGGSGRG